MTLCGVINVPRLVNVIDCYLAATTINWILKTGKVQNINNLAVIENCFLTFDCCQIRKSADCACTGNAGNVFPPPRISDPNMHHGTCVTHVLWCMPGSLTSGFLWCWWWEKRSRHSWRMRNPQLYISSKRPIDAYMRDKSTLVQVMAWCRQTTSHYLSQCWLSSLSPYGVARPLWVRSRDRDTISNKKIHTKRCVG